MHKFLRAIGFSDITKKDLEMILDEVITRPEIMKITGLSRASVHSYLPYVRGIYNTEELSLDAKRCRMYRKRMERV